MSRNLKYFLKIAWVFQVFLEYNKKHCFFQVFQVYLSPVISPVRNMILKIWETPFELIQIEAKCSKNYFKTFLAQEAGAFRNSIEKGTAKTTPKIERICLLYIYSEYFLCLQSNASERSLQKCINFVEQRLKLSHFEGSIIP